jgi:intracellular sulfur oxidation DsrE/DsrF family protein
MQITTRIVRALAAMMLVFGLAVGANAGAADKQGVVIQVSDNDPARWNLAINNAKNIQNDLGKDNVTVEIVAFGPGINMLKSDSEVSERLGAGIKDGMQIRACANSMKAFKLTDKDLYAGVQTVPSGVVEIMKKQKEGWAYLRP